MTTKNDLLQTIHRASIGKRMLQGAAIAFIFISLFLFSAGESNPSWPKLWVLKPLIITPIAGAMGGVFYYIMDHLRYQGGWKTALAFLFSLIGYLVALWMGTVLGLNGTYWN